MITEKKFLELKEGQRIKVAELEMQVVKPAEAYEGGGYRILAYAKENGQLTAHNILSSTDLENITICRAKKEK